MSLIKQNSIPTIVLSWIKMKTKKKKKKFSLESCQTTVRAPSRESTLFALICVPRNLSLWVNSSLGVREIKYIKCTSLSEGIYNLVGEPTSVKQLNNNSRWCIPKIAKLIHLGFCVMNVQWKQVSFQGSTLVIFFLIWVWCYSAHSERTLKGILLLPDGLSGPLAS